MSETTINLILWVPFLIALVASSIRFVVTGLGKGHWVSLLYLAATLVLAAVAIPVAKQLAPLVAEPVGAGLAKVIPAETLAQLPGGEAFLPAVATMLAGMGLYITIFAILTAVGHFLLGLLAILLGSKRLMARVLGIVVGVVHAVVYPMLLLLPLYGTLAVFLPTVRTLQTPGEESTFVELAEKHPLVDLAKTEPMQWYYQGLTTVEMDGQELHMADLAVTVEAVVQGLQDGTLFENQDLLAQLDGVFGANDAGQNLKAEILGAVIGTRLFGGDREAGVTFVKAMQADPDTAALMELQNLGALAMADTPEELLEAIVKAGVKPMAVLRVLTEQDLTHKLTIDLNIFS